MKSKKDLEIFNLPIIVTERDLQLEKDYLEYYNDDYWRSYYEKNKKKIKKK